MNIQNKMQRLNELEIPLCYFFNRLNHISWLSLFFSGISRLGNGVIWYSLMLALPVIYGSKGLETSLHMAVTCIVVLLIYRRLKSSTARIRPYRYVQRIFRNAPVLDQFSFPSGHTMHAVAFTVILLYHHPSWFWLVVPFTFLTALSRVVLGLHYPSDVIMGSLLGGTIALGSIQLMGMIF